MTLNGKRHIQMKLIEEEQFLLNVAKKILSSLIESGIRNFIVYKRNNDWKLTIPSNPPLLTQKIYYMEFDDFKKKLFRILNPRFHFIKNTPKWEYDGHAGSLSLLLKPFAEWN